MKVLEYYRIFVVFQILLVFATGACIQSTDLDSLSQYSDSYCLPVIQWNISQTSVSRYSQLDQIARNRYSQLYNNYYLINKADIDCLGMNKYFFCASAYPVCIDDGIQQKDSTAMCSWLCELYQTRCSLALNLVTDICSNDRKSDSLCSFQIGFRVLTFGLLILLFMASS